MSKEEGEPMTPQARREEASPRENPPAGQAPADTPEVQAEEGDDNLSRNADFSTYVEDAQDREGEYPTPGRQVEQTRGEPTESPESFHAKITKK